MKEEWDEQMEEEKDCGTEDETSHPNPAMDALKGDKNRKENIHETKSSVKKVNNYFQRNLYRINSLISIYFHTPLFHTLL